MKIVENICIFFRKSNAQRIYKRIYIRKNKLNLQYSLGSSVELYVLLLICFATVRDI